jgi:predicted NodU family carbamoyl transferase
MVTVGLYVGERETAAAIGADGTVVSAVTRPFGPMSGADGAVLACVEQVFLLSGLSARHVDSVVVVHDSSAANPVQALGSDYMTSRTHRDLRAALQEKPVRQVGCLTAQAAQFRGERGNGVIIAVNDGGLADAQAFSKRGTELTCLRSLSGIRDLFRAAGYIADALGAEDHEHLSVLDRYYGSPDPSIHNALSACVEANGDASVRVDIDAVERLLIEAQHRCPVRLDAREAVHVNVHRTRAVLATSTLDLIADVLAQAAVQLSSGADFIGFAGSAFDSPSLVARIESRIPFAMFSPASERSSAALGAALLPHETVSPLRELNLGPSFTDQEIKTCLENCHLDYVYEPDWNKLYARVSALLASGALVGWFQGKLEFGSRSLGTRTILCDPSNQYARENVNVFLLRREASAPIPVSISPGQQHVVPEMSAARFRYMNADMLPVPHEKLTAAVDRRGRCLAHIADERATPELFRLLAVHRARTGAPGLINVPLGTPPGGLAETPRAAIREAFGSAVDVLVLGRFLASKDYWLLRSHRA